ncbi:MULTISPECIES: DUF5076 domain-containing protein [Xanthomonas]|uniref:DUF5076 domain-containing protein n=1 Tax=Xanthomonas TaxID=338 RepID=UPI001F0B49A5|nr:MULTISPECIES: DUF5076 domain-containing protein [Xanthomonas]
MLITDVACVRAGECKASTTPRGFIERATPTREDMHDGELIIPPDALADPEAFELLRLWAANEQLHVSINRDLGGGAEDFGDLLADLFEHASRMYAQRDGMPLAQCRTLMLDDFLRRVADPSGRQEGALPVEH